MMATAGRRKTATRLRPQASERHTVSATGSCRAARTTRSTVSRASTNVSGGTFLLWRKRLPHKERGRPIRAALSKLRSNFGNRLEPVHHGAQRGAKTGRLL